MEYRLRGLPVKRGVWFWDEYPEPKRVLTSLSQRAEAEDDLVVSHKLEQYQKEAEELTASVYIHIPYTNVRRKEPDMKLSSRVPRNFMFRQRKAHLWDRT